jgi:hypothetical protein
VGIHGPAAAGAAVADGEKAPQHGVFEEGMVNMAPAVLLLEDRRRLFGGNPPASAGVMIRHEGGKGLSHDQADIQGKAGIGADGPAGAFQRDDVIGLPKDQISGKSVRNDAFEIVKPYFLAHMDQSFRRLKGHHFAMIAVGKRGLPSRAFLAPPVPAPRINAEYTEQGNTQKLQDF